MRSYIYTTYIAVSYVYIYTIHMFVYLLYALVHASAAETIRWWSVAAAAAAEMPRAHIIHCVCVCARARCTRVYTTPRRFVKKLALSGRNHLRRC
jgi:hypothetical protein